MKKLPVIGIAAAAVAIGLLSGCGSTSSTGVTNTTSVSQTSTTAPQTSPQPSTTATQPSPQPSTTAPEASYTEYAHVGLWWGYWEEYFSYVHFKAVLEPSGTTIVEATGSDSVPERDVELLPETPTRAALVDQLRSKMADLGWTEIGKSGPAWYEIQWAK